MKKAGYSEIVFTDQYYINGVDVFDDANVEFLGNIDVDLRMNLSFSKLRNAKLYKIKSLDCKIAIADVRDFKIVIYLSFKEFSNICNYPRSYDSMMKNRELEEELVINKIKQSANENAIYSPDFRTRAYISYVDGVLSLKYQQLEIEDETYFYFYEEVNSNNFWTWEDLPGVSFFDSFEDAKKEATAYLKNLYTPDEELDSCERLNSFKQPKILWSYTLTRFESFLYSMKYVSFGMIAFILLLCLFPLLGLSNWNVLWFILGVGLFSLIIAGLTLWFNKQHMSYAVTEKGIISFKGIHHECPFENIKKIKFKRNIFNKNKGSIKFKLYKGISINYNFDNIENYKEAYELINKKLDSFNQH